LGSIVQWMIQWTTWHIRCSSTTDILQVLGHPWETTHFIRPGTAVQTKQTGRSRPYLRIT
jgi:hypothetical protein